VCGRGASRACPANPAARPLACPGGCVPVHGGVCERGNEVARARANFAAVISISTSSRLLEPSHNPTDSRLLPIYVKQGEEGRCLAFMLVRWKRQNSAPSSSSSFFLSRPQRPCYLPLSLVLLLLLLPTMTPAFLLPSITSARMLRRSFSSWLKRGSATPTGRPCLSPSSVGVHSSSSSSSSYDPLFDDVPDRR
jgi:hypothetical protein